MNNPHSYYLHNQYLSTLTNLANLAIQANHHNQAVYYWQKILSLDPTREEVCIKLMDFLLHTDRRADALRYAESCEKALAELDVSPSTKLIVSKEMLTC